MKYFTPETSKKLEELGLKGLCVHVYSSCGLELLSQVEFDAVLLDEVPSVQTAYSTLDICELSNAKKLQGEEIVSVSAYPGAFIWENGLMHYITLSDEERIKYVEDYLKTL